MVRAGRLLFILVLAVPAAACTSSHDTGSVGSSTSESSDAPISIADDGIIAGLDAAEPIPDDDAVATGALANGLRYYVRENQSPGGQVELRLAVDAGSVLEDGDQSGAAHFLEHMLFNGTERYAGNELVKVLESFGSAFGADINASTSYDETVYSLSVPTQDPAVFAEALGILEQWLTRATLAEDDVIEERGVVLDEWRQSEQDASGRSFVAIERLFLEGTPYMGRNPIGTDTAIQAMTPEVLRRFYDEWYRPDNAAVVIVGDIDAGSVVEQLRDTFEGATDRAEGTERPAIELEPFDEPMAAIHLDPDETTSVVELTLPVPGHRQETPAELREATSIGLAFQMIANRLSDDVSRGDAPFSDASVSSNDFVRAIDAPSVLVNATAEDTRAALEAVLVEFARIDRHGFDESELARAVSQYRSGVQSTYDGRGTVQDVAYATTYVNSFVTGSPYPDARTSYDLAIEILDEVTVSAVEDAFAERRSLAAPHVLVIGPEDADAPTETDVLELIDEVARRALEPRTANAAVGTDLMVAPDAVEEISAEELEGDPGRYLNPTELTFPNGVRVVLNPTPIVEGTVLIGATSPGGLSLVADDEVAAANLAPYVVTTSGVGSLDQVQLEQALAETDVSVTPYLDLTSEGLSGSAGSTDLEALFQLIHLYMAEPRFEDHALETALDQVRPYVEDPNRDPDLAQQLALVDARYGEAASRYRPVPTVGELATIDLAGIERVWADRFGDAHDWVFVLAGDLDVDTATELARRYLGTLPATDRTEAWQDLQPDPPAGVVTREVRAGTGDRATLTVLSTAELAIDPSAEPLARLVNTVVDSRLTDHLREALGASYSPSAFISLDREPDPLIESYLQVTGAPEEMNRLSELLRNDLAELASDGPTADEMTAARQELANDLQLFSNEQLIDVITRELLGGGAIAEFLALPEVAANLDADAVREFAALAFPPDRYIQVIGLPA